MKRGNKVLNSKEIEKLQYGLNKLKGLEKCVYDVTDQFDCDIYRENSLYSTIVFYKGESDMAIITNPVQLTFKNPEQLTLSETKQIEQLFKNQFMYTIPTQGFSVQIGEVKNILESGYEVERFIPLTEFEPYTSSNKQPHLENVFETKIKEYIEIGYDHLTQKFTIDTEGEYIEDEETISELRTKNPFIDEILTLFNKQLMTDNTRDMKKYHNEIENLQEKELEDNIDDFSEKELEDIIDGLSEFYKLSDTSIKR